MTGIDYLVFLIYLALCVALGVWAGGKPGDTQAYFNSKGEIPWWAVAISIVATETSMLTIISTPSIAYFGTLSFLQIVAGYILGRLFLAFTIIPSYFKGEQDTAYSFFSVRFGTNFRKLTSVTFLVTRLLADGVRLFAAAIPVKLITGFSYAESILIIALLTLAYTYYGGLKSVIWIDVLQMFVYLSAGLYILFSLSSTLPSEQLQLITSDKLSVISLPESFSEIWLKPYNLIACLVGGAFLSMASHGTDHIIVQRLLACNQVKEARKALIWSGFIVLLQFALFLGIGLYLFAFYQGAGMETLGIAKVDELFTKFIVDELPVGFTGFVIAALFAAAMSTMSSSLSALSSSTLFDLFPKLSQHAHAMRYSRMFMVLWTVIFIVFGLSFTSTNNPVIEIGLGIAGFTYGGLLGAFLIGRYTRWDTATATFGLLSTVATMTLIILFSGEYKPWWAWYTFIGVVCYGIYGGVFHWMKTIIKPSRP
jgi:SSS family solute:Na+ symporter